MPHSPKRNVIAVLLALLLLFTFHQYPANALPSENVHSSGLNESILLLQSGDKQVLYYIVDNPDGQPVFIIYVIYVTKILAMSDDLSPEENQALHDELAQTTSKDFTVEVITEDNLSDFSDISEDVIIQQAKQAKDDGYELTITLASAITVSKDGYYRFRINIPDELVGQKVSDLKLYASEVDASGDIHASAGLESVVWTILDLETLKITDTLKDSVMVATLLPIEKSLVISFAKTLILLLGGCESDTLGSVALFSVLAAIIFLVKRHKKYLPH